MQFLLYLATLNLIFICLVLHVLSTQFQNCCVHSFNSALSAQVEMETQCGCILLLCHLEWVIWFGCVHWSQRVNLVKSCSDSFQRHSFVWGWSEGWSAPRNLGWTYRSNQPTPRTAAFLFFFFGLGMRTGCNSWSLLNLHLHTSLGWWWTPAALRHLAAYASPRCHCGSWHHPGTRQHVDAALHQTLDRIGKNKGWRKQIFS